MPEVRITKSIDFRMKKLKKNFVWTIPLHLNSRSFRHFMLRILLAFYAAIRARDTHLQCKFFKWLCQRLL